jgi:hypothetical protein
VALAVGSTGLAGLLLIILLSRLMSCLAIVKKNHAIDIYSLSPQKSGIVTRPSARALGAFWTLLLFAGLLYFSAPFGPNIDISIGCANGSRFGCVGVLMPTNIVVAVRRLMVAPARIVPA